MLLGAVGAPEFDRAEVRPEQGLIGLRKELDVYANLRPARGEGVDLLVVRELVAGLYYGERGTREDGTVYDTLEYRPDQVERIARTGFEIARGRRGHVTSVDKANILSTSRLWRDVVEQVASGYPDVELEHMLVDNCGMQLVLAPGPLRRDPDREHVRGHPLRRRRGRDRRARPRRLRQPRRRAARDLRAGARVGAGHRREGRSPTLPPCSAPPRSCSRTGSGSPARLPGWRRRSTPPSRRRRRPDLGGSATTDDVVEAVLRELSSR